MDRYRLSEDNRRWWTLGAMCFALFMLMLDSTVVNVALPSIQRSLDAPISALEWTVNAYTLAIAVLLVTAGRLGDLFGRVRMFVFGIVVFTASSAVIALSPDATWLVVGRAVQGVGAAFMMPGTLSIISNAFPPEERGRAIGIWAGVSALGLAIGPLAGGLLVEHVSWQSIFLLNVPIGIAAVFVTLFSAHESRDETVERSIDVPGIVTLTGGLTALVLAIVEANHWGWGSASVIGLLVAAFVLLTGFVAIERRSRAPMVDFSFFQERSYLGAILVALCVSFAMFATFFFITLYLQNIHGYSAVETGIWFLPMTIVLIAMGPIAGRLVNPVGGRILLAAGLTITGIALLWQSFLYEGAGFGFLLPAFVVQAVGMGLTMSPMTTTAMNAVDKSKAGVASGVLSMSRMVGSAFGVAVIGAIVAVVGRHDLASSLSGAQPELRDRLGENLGAIPVDTLSPRVGDAATDAFIHALQVGLKVSAAIAFAGAILAWKMIAKRSPTEAAPEQLLAETPVAVGTASRVA